MIDFSTRDCLVVLQSAADPRHCFKLPLADTVGLLASAQTMEDFRREFLTRADGHHPRVKAAAAATSEGQ